MNSLDINLKEGQKVVMQGHGSEEHRTVTVVGGFGMVSFTSGSALFVKTASGESLRMDGHEIEKLVEDSPAEDSPEV